MTAVPSTHILNDGMPMRSEKCLVRFGSEAEISRASQNVRSGPMSWQCCGGSNCRCYAFTPGAPRDYSNYSSSGRWNRILAS